MKFFPHRPSLHPLAGPASLLLAALLSGHVAAQTAKPATPASAAAAPSNATHPLVGAWSWTLPGKQCVETWKYRADGTRLGTSGEEVTQGDYQAAAKPTTTGFYPVTETVTSSNGKRDCSGDLHTDGDESVIRFIQFSPKQDQFIVCKTASLEACFGPLKRVQ